VSFNIVKLLFKKYSFKNLMLFVCLFTYLFIVYTHTHTHTDTDMDTDTHTHTHTDTDTTGTSRGQRTTLGVGYLLQPRESWGFN
jgi:hypothetical protein